MGAVSACVTADPSRYFLTPRGERAHNRLRLVDTSRHTGPPLFVRCRPGCRNGTPTERAIAVPTRRGAPLPCKWRRLQARAARASSLSWRIRRARSAHVGADPDLRWRLSLWRRRRDLDVDQPDRLRRVPVDLEAARALVDRDPGAIRCLSLPLSVLVEADLDEQELVLVRSVLLVALGGGERPVRREDDGPAAI